MRNDKRSAGFGANPFAVGGDDFAAILPWLLDRKHHFGITRLADVTGLDRLGVPVAIAVRPNSRSVTVSQGKGASIEAARIAAMMEAIELWHAETLAGPLWYGSYNDLSEQFAMAPPEWLSRCTLGRWRPDVGMHWMLAKDALGAGEVLVPYASIHMNMAGEHLPNDDLFGLSSNGLASGATLEGALQHALCELIERDALTVWHHRPIAARADTRIDPWTVGFDGMPDAWCNPCGDFVSLAAFDITSDIGVPTFLCCLLDELGHLGIGSAAHPDAPIAFGRAFVEAAQTRMTYITGSRDDLAHAEFEAEGRLAKLSIGRNLFQLGDPTQAWVSRDVAMPGTEGRSALEKVVIRLRDAGMDGIHYVDLTRREWQIPVVRAIVPGLERPHDEIDFMPGARALQASREP